VSTSVSFLLPVKNVESYFDNIVKNLLGNLTLSDEVIIIDDKSDDNSYSLLAQWADCQIFDIQVVQNSGIGLVSALNLGLSLARYDWVARFDADDVYPINRIDLQRNYMGDGVAVIFSDYTINNPKKRIKAFIPSAVFDPQVRISLISSNRTPHPSALMNKHYVSLAGGYQSKFFPAEDLALWFRISALGSLVSVPEILLDYYRNNNSVTSTKQIEMLKMKKLVLSELAPQMIDDGVLQRNYLNLYLQYRWVSHAAARRLLFVKDLMVCTRFTKEKKLHIRKMIPLLLFLVIDFRNLLGLVELFSARINLIILGR
jgi:glycosyltransferase involved in cell wall biosynthesis